MAMDEFTALFVNRDNSPERVSSIHHSESDNHAASEIIHADQQDCASQGTNPDGTPVTPGAPGKEGKKSLRQKMAAIRDKASLQDHLLEKVLSQLVPEDERTESRTHREGTGMEFYENRPNFNLPTMSNNFRRFNARIGVVFKFQEQVVRIITWQKYSHTLSVLAVYSFVCLDPYLLPILPLAILLLGVFIPSFLARHPAPPQGPESLIYSPKGPALAPPRTVKPAKELSRDFLQNMRDLQNCMDDFCVGHDQVVSTIVPITNFSDEAYSSTIFLFMFVASVLMSISAHLLPWRFLFFTGGWIVIGSNYPLVARILEATHKEHVEPQEQVARRWLDSWIERDIMLDSAPETKEVEVFELQKMTLSTGEWEPWLFSPSPYDPLSPQRINDERPKGTRFFEDVLPPDGWVWSEKKWALDLWSREWVEDRIITGVEVETEGERWVYDTDTGSQSLTRKASNSSPSSLDEEGWMGMSPEVANDISTYNDGEGVSRRGEWRRRRWVRVVQRQKVENDAS